MRTSKLSCLWVTLFFFTQVLTAQSELSQADLETLIQKLTENSRETWLTQGSLNAVRTIHRAPAIQDEHELQAIIADELEKYINNPNKAQKTPLLQAQFLEAIPFNTRFKYSNQSTRVTTEYIRVEGEKFYCDTSINSHEDSITPDLDLAQNQFIHEFNLATNRTRVFSYDGKRKFEYYKSANLGIEKDSLGTPSLPKALQAGLVSWGTGLFTRENILESYPSASIQWIDGVAYIVLEFQNEMASVSTTLDSSKSLAVRNCTVTRSDGLISNYSLSQYIQVNDQWIPTSIYIEQQILENTQYRLLKFEQWQLDILESFSQDTFDFSPHYDEDALIKYFSPLSKSPLHYRYRSHVNTDELLAQRLFTLTDSRPKNCATVAIEYIAQKLDTPLTESPSSMIDYAGTSSLYDMQQFFLKQGLFAKTIKTTVEKLPLYKDYFVIAHLPNLTHYVIVESVDDDNVWTIDLSSNNLYMSHSKGFFQANWVDGTALLVSKQSIVAPEVNLDSMETQAILGGIGYQCLPEQEFLWIPCYITNEGVCVGSEQVFFAYRTCQEAAFGQCEDSLEVFKYQLAFCENTLALEDICEAEIYSIETIDACYGLVPR